MSLGQFADFMIMVLIAAAVFEACLIAWLVLHRTGPMILNS